MAEKDETVTAEKVAAGAEETIPTDEELSASWDAIVTGEKTGDKPAEKVEEPEKTEEVKISEEPEKAAQPSEEEPPPPVTPREKTWHGRFLKAQEENARLREQITSGKFPEPDIEAESPSDEEEEFVTTKDLPKFFKRIDDASDRYQRDYVTEITKLAKTPDGKMMDETTFAEIYEEMIANFNIRRGDKYAPKSWNPGLDAQLNWVNAKAAVYEKKAQSVNPAVKGKPVTQPVGLTATVRTEPLKKAVPQLDDAALGVLKGSGLTDEEINDALTGEKTYFVHQRSGV